MPVAGADSTAQLGFVRSACGREQASVVLEEAQLRGRQLPRLPGGAISRRHSRATAPATKLSSGILPCSLAA